MKHSTPYVWRNSFYALAGLVFLFALCALPFPATAAFRVDIVGGPSKNSIPIAMASPLVAPANPANNLGPELDKAIQHNIGFLPFLRLVDQQAILGGTKLEGFQPPKVDFRRFQLGGADLLITSGWPQGDSSGATVELRLFETLSGQFIFGSSYKVTPDTVFDVADAFCAGVMKSLTGKDEFFRSSLAYTKASGKFKKDVWMSGPTGRKQRQLTSIDGAALSPAWSKDGRYIVFTHLDDKSHSLGVYDHTTGKTQRIRFPGNMVIAPAFTPDNKVAVSLSTGGYPDIYQLNHSFQKERALEESPAINISPTFDAKGTKMAFCSSRLGGPQIFVKDLSSGTITRVSRQGGYNTEPSMSPDGTLIAFSRLTDYGHRIFVYDTITGMERQVSFGPGSDEQPSFAPDSYFLAFTSTRNGARQIFLTTRMGGDAKHLPTGSGEVAFPRWGLIP